MARRILGQLYSLSYHLIKLIHYGVSQRDILRYNVVLSGDLYVLFHALPVFFINPILDGVRVCPILDGGGKPPGLTLPFSV